MVRKWTSEQEVLLRSQYGKRNINELVAVLPFTKDAIFKKAQRMGLKYPKVTEEQIKNNERRRSQRYSQTPRGRRVGWEATMRFRYGSLEAYEEATLHRRGKDGIVYDSVEESLVANMLFDNGIRYRRNRKKFGRFVPDFIVNGEVIVEYFGLLRSGKPDHQGYKKKVEAKIRYYTKEGYNFVALYHEDLVQEKVLEKVMEVL